MVSASNECEEITGPHLSIVLAGEALIMQFKSHISVMTNFLVLIGHVNHCGVLLHR